MRDDEMEAGSEGFCDGGSDVVHGNANTDLFGDFSVLGAGVHIVLDGRTVTSSLR